MNPTEFITHPDIADILDKGKKIVKKKKLVGYNLFTISSYSYHLENFHSDIIASLLDPNGLHEEGYAFLSVFIEFVTKLKTDIVDARNYSNTTVEREKGRLDIWVKDESSKHCFIIENKINDAVDRDDQLLDYVRHAQASGYVVDLVIYLSKDGTKVAPAQSEVVSTPILNVPAFNNTKLDLLNGWLIPARDAAMNEDGRSFLYQYCKLITHLSNSQMENEIKEQFYQFVSTNKATEAIDQLKDLIINLPNYRAQRFGPLTENFAPFGNRFRYQQNYWVFEKYVDGLDSYKLDVFFENNGGAKVVMWNTVKQENGGYETVEAKLKQIGLREKFNGQSLYNGLTAEFNISFEFESIGDVDNGVLELVQNVFLKLKAL